MRFRHVLYVSKIAEVEIAKTSSVD